MQNKQYQLAELERILRLLAKALRRANLSHDMPLTEDDVKTNAGYIAEAKELLSDLAKQDAATFTRDPKSK